MNRACGHRRNAGTRRSNRNAVSGDLHQRRAAAPRAREAESIKMCELLRPRPLASGRHLRPWPRIA
jgi:hypothetical protein